MCCCDVKTLMEAHRIDPLAAELLLAWLLESTKDARGCCHNEHGYLVPCGGRKPTSKAVRVGRLHGYHVEQARALAAQSEATTRELKFPTGHGYNFVRDEVLRRGMDVTQKAELAAAVMLGHAHIGRTNTGDSKNAFDAANGRWPDGTLELVDAKTSKDQRGLQFKKSSRENQFDVWRKSEDEKPNQTIAAQLVFHRGSKGVPAGVYLIPGIPMDSTVPLKNAGSTFNPKSPETPIFVHPLTPTEDAEK